MMTGDLKRQQREEEDRKMAEKFDKPQGAPGAAKTEEVKTTEKHQATPGVAKAE
jgi:hypothetical protein